MNPVYGTVRPIAMGECLLKLAAAIRIKGLQPKIQSYFLEYGTLLLWIVEMLSI